MPRVHLFACAVRFQNVCVCVSAYENASQGLIIAATNASSHFQCGNSHFRMSLRFQFCQNSYELCI